MNKFSLISRYNNFKKLSKEDKKAWWSEFMIENALYIFLIIAIIFISIKKPSFVAASSVINILTLAAANMPIALGIAGTIVLTGTDLSAGRIVGLTACISASLLQRSDYANKMFPNIDAPPIIVIILLVILVGGFFGLINGYCVSKFSLHPFIVTLATQLIVYGLLLMYLNLGNNNGNNISGMNDAYKLFITGSIIKIFSTPIPNFFFYSIIMTIFMWILWNKTVFGKNMFAVGSNLEAARVSGVNVNKTITLVFVLAGAMYGLTGFVEGARIGSNSAITGLNYELDAIAACVIGGVSFVGGIGKISGIIMGVLLLRIIFVGLTVMSVDQNLQYIIKGLIILIACAIDMRKYLVRK